MSSQTQPSHTFRPTSDTPPVSFADSPLGEGAWIYWIFANFMTLLPEGGFPFVNLTPIFTTPSPLWYNDSVLKDFL